MRVAEVQAGARGVVELVVGLVVPHPVAPVIGEVEFPGRRMPVHTHAVTDAAREGFEAAAVGAQPDDLGVGVRRQTDVAGRPDVEVELAVGAEGEELPPVRLVLRQPVVDHDGLRRIVEPILDPLEFQDPAQLGDVEGAILEGDAVRAMEPLGDELDLAPVALVHDRVHVAD
jgi:hypothetical protein